MPKIFTELRSRAEKILNTKNQKTSKTTAELFNIMDELLVYQTELEIQNEDLMKMQIELQKSQRDYFELYDLAPISHFTLNKDGLIDQVNQAGAILLGITKNKLLKRCFSRYIVTEYQALFTLHRQYILQKNLSKDFEIKVMRWNGPSFYAKVNCKPMSDSHTGEIKILMSIMDVTQEKLAQQSLHQQRCNLANMDKIRSINELVHSLSYQVTQPLTVMENYINGCVHRIEKNNYDPPQLKEVLNKVSKQSRTVIKIISQIKILTAKDFFNYEIANLSEIIKDTICLIKHETNKFPVTIHYDRSDDIPQIRLDKLRIQGVFLNIARNAFESMRDARVKEPQLIIETAIKNKNDNQITVSICDNGPGFYPMSEQKLFESCFTTKSYSMGLGLKVSRTVVEKHGGTLNAKSSAMGGACFEIMLPLRSMTL